jgi:hypothetical protein
MTNVNINDLELILTGARAFQDKRDYLEALKSLGLNHNPNKLPIEAIYEVAETIGIQKEFVDYFIKVNFPSKQQQLKSLGELGAKPSRLVIAKVYYNTLLNDLTKHFPNEKFEGISCYDWDINWDFRFFYMVKQIEKIEIIERWFKDKKRKKIDTQKLAHFNFKWSKGGAIEIYEPSFIEACKESLIKLNNHFSNVLEVIDIKYEYNPYLATSNSIENL